MSSTDLQVLRLYKLVGRLERQVAFLFDHLGLEYHEEPHADVPPEILELVRRGDKIKAIQEFRKMTGFELGEAKRFIESIEL